MLPLVVIQRNVLLVTFNKNTTITNIDVLYNHYTIIIKIFLRKDITLTRNRVIRFCTQNPTAPPISVQFSELYVVYNVNSYQTIHL